MDNTPFPGELGIEKLANKSKSSCEPVTENFVSEMDSKFEKLANEIDNCFVRIEDRMEELTSHFNRMYDQLPVLCKVISSNDMNPNLNGRNITCASRLYCDDDDESNFFC